MRVLARRSQAYASNSHIFLVWMGGTSLVLLGVAILFLRNQIRPILRLADAAESFGKGREVEFRPRGAREVRQAGPRLPRDAAAHRAHHRAAHDHAERRQPRPAHHPHPLQALARARCARRPRSRICERDVDEMSRMLEGYLAFARGDAGEQAVATDLRALLEELQADAERQGHATSLDIVGDPHDHRAPGRLPAAPVQPRLQRRPPRRPHRDLGQPRDALARDPRRRRRAGHPADQREEVFKPFVRLDEARNQDEGGSGLGLAIARDIARSHGGDITLGDSPLGACGRRCGCRLTARADGPPHGRPTRPPRLCDAR